MKRWQMWVGCVALLVSSVAASGQAAGTNDSREAAREAERKRVFERAAVQAHETEDRYQGRLAELHAIQAKIRKDTGLLEVTPEGLRQLVDRLQQQAESLELEEVGAAGRQNALEAAIAKYSAQMRKRAEADDVAQELTKVLEMRRNQLARMRELMKQGTLTQAELDAAEAAVAQAQAEVAASRQRAAGAAGDTLEAWNRELVNLSVAAQERRAKLSFIRDRLKKLEPALDDARALERILPELKRAERWLDAALEQMHALEAAR